MTQARTAQQLATAKLAQSGLAAGDLKALGWQALEPAETAKLDVSFRPLAALQLVYHTSAGKPRPDGFYRLRYLETEASFAAQSKKPLRYTQPPDTGVAAYFTKLQRWEKLLSNPEEPLLLTEGELKAACACKHGFPTIGLGGVFNWRSAKLGLPMLPELRDITWANRYVYLAFDSDYRSNPMVTAALGMLADQLTKLGARPHLVSLPDLEGQDKTGLDDFIVAEGAPAFEALLTQAEPWGTAKSLWAMNSEVLYVRDPGLVVVQADGRQMSASAFKEHAYSHRKAMIKQVGPDGEPKLKEISLPKAWLEWEHRFEVPKVLYEPGKPKITERGYNRWPGWPCEPKKGDVSLWHQLIDHLFSSAKDPGAKRWFEQWCAYPIQYPGTKLFSSATLWGRIHGTGKSLVGVSLGKVYGENYAPINQTHLTSGDNAWAVDKQFILADDLTGIGPDKRHIADVLKTMITQEKMWINIKYVPKYAIRDCVNYMLTGNHPDLLLLEPYDRRHFIWEVTEERLDEDFIQEYDLWLHSTRIGPALMHHLLKVDTSDFNPSGDAYMTAAKRDMIVTSLSDIAEWLAGIKQDPEHALRVGQAKIMRDLFTTSEIRDLVDPSGKITLNYLGRELKRAGFRLVNQGMPLRTKRGVFRYYALRNAKKWLSASSYAIADHLGEHHDEIEGSGSGS